MSAAEIAAPSLRRRVARQGALILGGYAAAQACAFARNALLGHMLSKGDFGTAAALTLMLQALEQVSDVAVDRMLLQAKDADDPRLLATAHMLNLARGLVIALAILLAAPSMAALFGCPEATEAFRAIALVPLIRALMHLDQRLAQRRLDNRQSLLVEVVPQVVALAATIPLIGWLGGYAAVVAITLCQAITAIAVSHAVAATPYRVLADRQIVFRFLRFGWPIMLSAVPLLAIYQGERMIVGGVLGVEALAGMTAAFLVTMVPGALAARGGVALMLPLFAETLGEGGRVGKRFLPMLDATAAAAIFYWTGFALLGGTVLPLAFGDRYHDLGLVVAALAAMWAMRMLQVPAGALLLAAGDTKPLLIAGTLRAAALLPAIVAAHQGADLAVLASIGVAGEVLSLGYVAATLRRIDVALAKGCLGRAALLAAAILAVLPFVDLAGRGWPAIAATALTIAALASLAPILTVLLPGARREAIGLVRCRFSRPQAPASCGAGSAEAAGTVPSASA